MPARIFCKVGELKGSAAEIDREIVLGRSRKAALCVQAEMISSEHARIRHDADAGCYILEDLGSTNGTALDGVRVRRPRPLGHLHVITLANEYDFIFQDLDLCARRHADAGAFISPGKNEMDGTRIEEIPAQLPDALAQQADAAVKKDPDGTFYDEAPPQLPGFLAQQAEQAQPDEKPTVGLDPMPFEDAEGPPTTSERPSLHGLVDGPLGGGQHGPLGLEISLPDGKIEIFTLDEGEHVVGRGEDAAILISTPEVSRRHAVLKVSDGKVTAEDLGSSNHTFLNGKRFNEAREVPPGSQLRFGSVEARLIAEAPTEED